MRSRIPILYWESPAGSHKRRPGFEQFLERVSVLSCVSKESQRDQEIESILNKNYLALNYIDSLLEVNL